VVPLLDPETGLPLLVGTVETPAQAAPLAHRLAQAELLPTLLGAAALARADTVSLRRRPGGFVLAAGAEGLRLGTGTNFAEPDAAAMTRLFDLPLSPPVALTERLRQQQAGIAAAAPLQRSPLRRDAGETLLALGLPQEAQAMLALAFEEDPRAAADPRLLALHGAAALLAGRVPEARHLDDPRLPVSDEVALWQGLLAAARGDGPAATGPVAGALPMVFAYPSALRARLLPIVADVLSERDDVAALRRLLARQPNGPGLGLAAARLAELEGRHAEAIAGYAAVAAGRDRRQRARALRRSIELRLSTGVIDAATAA
jgi:hypothetical protein